MCNHENTTTVLREHITHPDDPISTSEWEEEVCDDCGEIVGNDEEA